MKRVPFLLILIILIALINGCIIPVGGERVRHPQEVEEITKKAVEEKRFSACSEIENEEQRAYCTAQVQLAIKRKGLEDLIIEKNR
ncbi:MAG TPA: hypothetical protein VJK05_02895 [archaeon]|nr:hypothetical protein [archaeon]